MFEFEFGRESRVCVLEGGEKKWGCVNLTCENQRLCERGNDGYVIVAVSVCIKKIQIKVLNIS